MKAYEAAVGHARSALLAEILEEMRAIRGQLANMDTRLGNVERDVRAPREHRDRCQSPRNAREPMVFIQAS